MEEEREFEDSSDFDLNYEFDAPRFFDFTTLELASQAEEAERWFLFANTYSPSPLIIKLKWRSNEVVYGEPSTSKSADSVGSEDTTQGNGSQKSKLKSQLRPYSPKSSTLLKPTASHLAKFNHIGASSARSNGRTQNPSSPVNHSAGAVATKRQKLENGYSKKAAQLKYLSSFAHKSSRKVISSGSGSTPIKPKVTVPKGPIPETNCRDRRYRSVKAACPGDAKIPKHCTFKARPLNKKDGLSSKRSPLSPQSPKSDNSSEDVIYRFKSQPANSKEIKLSGDEKCSHNPPTELFSKLSLTSDNQTESQKQSPKDLKENLPQTFPANGIVSPSKSPWCNVKHSQCVGVKAITDFSNRPSFTTSLKIH